MLGMLLTGGWENRRGLIWVGVVISTYCKSCKGKLLMWQGGWDWSKGSKLWKLLLE